MKEDHVAFTLNGKPPDAVGRRLRSLILQQLIEGANVADPVNVAHLEFEGVWYRLYFEAGTIFWRESETPVAPEKSGLSFGLILNNLSGLEGVVAEEVRSLSHVGYDSGELAVTFLFSSGRTISFEYSSETDSTNIVC